MLDHFRRFARYNRWANARLYEAIGQLTPEAFNAPRSGFFPSLSRTLNHLLATDRIWLGRFTGTDHGVKSLDEVLYPDFKDLKAARLIEDEAILAYVNGLSAGALERPLRYRTMTDGKETQSELGPTLAHFFNHQTHHRGQAHAMLSSSEIKPPSLDLIYFLRESD